MSRELCRKIVANVRAMFDDLPDDGQGPLVVLGQGEYAREVGGERKQPTGMELIDMYPGGMVFVGKVGDQELCSLVTEAIGEGRVYLSVDESVADVILSRENATTLAKWLQEAAQ